MRADFSAAPTGDYSKQSVAVQPSDLASGLPSAPRFGLTPNLQWLAMKPDNSSAT
ncbi:hypothetical protein X743_26105 [Mesorhizobium sp. LNHC252B00]|nr:hypothetical protein X743_26105 [Mesorhizobium sp. LNHC252B00]